VDNEVGSGSVPAGHEVAGPKGEEAAEMLETAVMNQDEDVERKQKWDSFLDAYSVYMRDPTPVNAAALHLAGVAVETSDGSFSLQTFETRLGWNLVLG
jgi:hypothetical protein